MLLRKTWAASKPGGREREKGGRIGGGIRQDGGMVEQSRCIVGGSEVLTLPVGEFSSGDAGRVDHMDMSPGHCVAAGETAGGETDKWRRRRRESWKEEVRQAGRDGGGEINMKCW